MRIMTIAARSLIAVALVSSSLSAQRGGGRRAGRAAGRAAPGCAVDTTAEWYKSQRAFADDSRHDWTDDAMRQRLLTAAGYKADAAFAPELGWRFFDANDNAPVDSAIVAELKAMAAKRQWVSRATVGVAGVHAAWLISLRVPSMTEGAMHRMMEGGPGESSSADVAVVSDLTRAKAGRGQIFGTLFERLENGAVKLYKLEDSAHVDMRREASWLPSLATSACLAAQGARK